MQVQINLSPELEQRVKYWAGKSDETPEQLALRLLAEYVDDCDDVHKISA